VSRFFVGKNPTLLVRWALTLYVWCDHTVYGYSLSGAYARFFFPRECLLVLDVTLKAPPQGPWAGVASEVGWRVMPPCDTLIRSSSSSSVLLQFQLQFPFHFHLNWEAAVRQLDERGLLRVGRIACTFSRYRLLLASLHDQHTSFQWKKSGCACVHAQGLDTCPEHDASEDGMA